MGDIRSIVDWLTDGARSASGPETFCPDLCDRLVAGGIPLWRVAVFVELCIPKSWAARFIWQTVAGASR